MKHPYLLAGCILWVVNVGCSREVDFERMRRQQRADPYAASDAFRDGMAMRIPPAGTVPVGTSGYRALATDVPSGASADALLPSSEATIDRGRREFDVFCAVCHGAEGGGQSVMAGNMPGEAPPSLVSGHAAERPPRELFDIISRGRERMPAYDWALPVADRWAVVAYLQTVQRRAALPAAETRR